MSKPDCGRLAGCGKEFPPSESQRPPPNATSKWSRSADMPTGARVRMDWCWGSPQSMAANSDGEWRNWRMSWKRIGDFQADDKIRTPAEFDYGKISNTEPKVL